LFAQLIQQRILFNGKPSHPPKTDTPTNGARHGHPKCQSVFTHKRFRNVKGAAVGSLVPPAATDATQLKMKNTALNLMIQSIHRQSSEQNGV
jgi:hypothetical protein